MLNISSAKCYNKINLYYTDMVALHLIACLFILFFLPILNYQFQERTIEVGTNLSPATSSVLLRQISLSIRPPLRVRRGLVSYRIFVDPNRKFFSRIRVRPERPGCRFVRIRQGSGGQSVRRPRPLWPASWRTYLRYAGLRQVPRYGIVVVFIFVIIIMNWLISRKIRHHHHCYCSCSLFENLFSAYSIYIHTLKLQ